MKRILILFAIFAIFTLISTEGNHADVEFLRNMNGEPQKEIFKAFHFIYNKEYDLNSEEGVKRYRIFKENSKFIEQLNKDLGKIVYGPTEFMDMTHEEFIEKRLVKTENIMPQLEKMKENSLRFLHEDNHHHHHEHNYSVKDEPVDPIVRRQDNHLVKDEPVDPIVRREDDNHNLKNADVDWRQYEGPVKNQGACGSCWAFAAIAAVENAYTRLKGNYTSFSEQYMVDCQIEKSNGCEGGHSFMAIKWIKDNGIVTSQVLPYFAKQSTCETKYQPYQYKIVNGQKMFYGAYPKHNDAKSMEELLQQGVTAVYMDASFKEFGFYAPKDSFLAIENPQCTKITHAVAAVAIVTENGKQYIICRNSWGTRWGYKGYFKMPLDKPCLMDQYAFLPLVIDGKVPDNNPPEPKPDPKKQDCIEVHPFTGFKDTLKKQICDSLPNEGENKIQVGGIKFPEVKNNPNLAVRLFKYQECWGQGSFYTDSVRITNTTEFPNITFEGKFQKYSWSLAYEKPAISGCVDFHEQPCLNGLPLFSICNDIKDSQGVSLAELAKINSINWNSSQISTITFYTEANYLGSSHSISGNVPLFQLGTNWNIYELLRDLKVRSIKILKK